MAKQTKAKRRDETEAQYLSRIARTKADERDRMEPIVPQTAQDNGTFVKGFVTHVETNTKAHTFRRDDLPAIVQAWARKGFPGFEEPALEAMRRCLVLWQARPVLGRMCASYGVTLPGGSSGPEEALQRNLDHADELARYQSWFHPAHWRVFVAVVRDDRPVCSAANEIENNAPQSTASARAIVGLVANVIAAKMGA